MHKNMVQYCGQLVDELRTMCVQSHEPYTAHQSANHTLGINTRLYTQFSRAFTTYFSTSYNIVFNLLQGRLFTVSTVPTRTSTRLIYFSFSNSRSS